MPSLATHIGAIGNGLSMTFGGSMCSEGNQSLGFTVLAVGLTAFTTLAYKFRKHANASDSDTRDHQVESVPVSHLET